MINKIFLVLLSFLLFFGCDLFGQQEALNQSKKNFDEWVMLHAPNAKTNCINTGVSVRCVVSDKKWNIPVSIFCSYRGCVIEN